MNLELYYQDNYDTFIKKVKRRAGGEVNAEDVVQEAFTRALKYQNSFDETNRPLDAWFNTILNNALRDFQRQERLFGMNIELDEEKIDGVDMKEIRGVIRKDLRKLIQQQPEPKATVLRLHFNKGYKTREIVNVVDVPLGTVFTTINRFKQEVQELYEERVDRGLGG